MKRIRLENPDITPAELEMKAREEVSSLLSFLCAPLKGGPLKELEVKQL